VVVVQVTSKLQVVVIFPVHACSTKKWFGALIRNGRLRFEDKAFLREAQTCPQNATFLDGLVR